MRKQLNCNCLKVLQWPFNIVRDGVSDNIMTTPSVEQEGLKQMVWV